MKLSYRAKIFLFVTALLLAVQAVSFMLVTNSTRARILENAVEDINLSQQIMVQYIEDLSRQALVTSEVSVRDFAVKQYLAGDDRATRLSVVRNIVGRTHADWGGFFDPERGIIDFTDLTPTSVRSEDNLQTVLSAMQEDGVITLSGVGDPNGSAQLMTVVAVDYPRTIGYMVVGFVLDDQTLNSISNRLPIDAQLSIYLPDREFMAATQFSNEILEELNNRVDIFMTPDKPGKVSSLFIQGEEFAIASSPFRSIGDFGVVELVVASSLARVEAEARDLALTLAALFAGALILAGSGAVIFSNRLSKPIEILTKAAQEIEAGEYTDLPDIKRSDEIGALAKSFSTMSRRVRDREKRLAYQARYDNETGLPNRSELSNRMTQRNDQVLLILQVDALEKLGYTLGRQTAQSVMTYLAATMTSLAGIEGLAARLGDDRFAIVKACGDCDPLDIAQDLYTRVIGMPVEVDGYEIDIHGNVAATLVDAANPAVTIGRAEAALYRGRTAHLPAVIYDVALDEPDIDALTLMGEMRKGFETGEIQLYVQPKVDLKTGKTIEAEALVRWFHEERGFIPPDKFVSLCEQTGRIHLLTGWVCQRAAEIVQSWRALGLDTRLAVNLSAQDMTDGDLPGRLTRIALDAGLSPADFVLEVTESAVMTDAKRALDIMKTLHDQGFELAIDDFGTGYSSLEYLRHLPVSEVKIDRSFVQDLDSNSDNRTIVQAAIQMAQGLGLKITAEGVENAETMALLAEMGCDKAQGYHIARPQNIEDFSKFLDESDFGRP